MYVYTDGASRGNPGESASGYHILDASRKLLYKHTFYNGVCTNNAAEYRAVIAALKKAISMGCDEVVLHSDSRLVINQISGTYKIRSKKLGALNAEARALLRKFSRHELLNVPRENKEVCAVDKEINLFLDKKPKKSINMQTSN